MKITTPTRVLIVLTPDEAAALALELKTKTKHARRTSGMRVVGRENAAGHGVEIRIHQ